MGELTDKLRALTVRATSPDGNIEVVLRSWDQSMEIAFRNDSYERSYTEESLAIQLSRMLTLLMAGREQGRNQALESAGWRPRDRSKPHWDKRKREYETAVMDAHAFGESVNEYIRIDSTALRGFTVSVAPSTRNDLDEEAFTTELVSAVTDLFADWHMLVTELRKEHVYQ